MEELNRQTSRLLMAQNYWKFKFKVRKKLAINTLLFLAFWPHKFMLEDFLCAIFIFGKSLDFMILYEPGGILQVCWGSFTL